MAKDEDLKILGAIAVTRADEETGERPNDQAEEEQHRRILESAQSWIWVFDPHAMLLPAKARLSSGTPIGAGTIVTLARRAQHADALPA
jgi:hypothetical protein